MSKEPRQGPGPSRLVVIATLVFAAFLVSWEIRDFVFESLPWFVAEPRRLLKVVPFVVVGTPLFVAYAKLPQRWQRGVNLALLGGGVVLALCLATMSGWALILTRDLPGEGLMRLLIAALLLGCLLVAGGGIWVFRTVGGAGDHEVCGASM